MTRAETIALLVELGLVGADGRALVTPALLATLLPSNTGTAWIPAVPSGTWVAFNSDSTLEYRLDGLSRVHLRGAVKGGTAGSVVTTLPAGYRPGATIAFHFPNGNNSPSSGSVTSDGKITPPTAAGNAFVGVFTSFLAEN